MTRSDLALLSQAHAVALNAMVAPETRPALLSAAEALTASAAARLPDFAGACGQFHSRLRQSRMPDQISAAGRDLRDAVTRAMAFRPVDANRVDIHG